MPVVNHPIDEVITVTSSQPPVRPRKLQIAFDFVTHRAHLMASDRQTYPRINYSTSTSGAKIGIEI
jgi:hypothetical protein